MLVRAQEPTKQGKHPGVAATSLLRKLPSFRESELCKNKEWRDPS